MNKPFAQADSKAWLFLPVLMIVGIALRLYGITLESLWWDEYASHVHLDAPSLLEFLSLNRTLDPLTLPVYYIFEYLWAHYIHHSVLSLRLLSVGINVATIPLIYLLGKRMHSAGAGYVAAALLVVSPVHIHHAQGIRMYVMLVFLAALMAWSFLALLDKPSRFWWTLHGMVSLFMYWTHPFAGLMTMALGVFFLVYCRSLHALFLRWCCLQALLLAPVAAYLASVRFWPQDTTGDWIARPSLQALVADIFFDDITAFHWQFRLSGIAQGLGPVRWVPDLLLAALICALLAFLCIKVLALPRENPAARRCVTLLGLWLVLPPSILFLASWTVRPCMFPRYTVHCMLALYLLLALATQAIRAPLPRGLVAALLVALTLTQWLWLQPGPQRTDWRAAGLLLHEQAGRNDIVLVEGLLWRDVFVHNLEHMTPGRLDAPVAAAEKAPALAAQTAVCLGMTSARENGAEPGRIWAVVPLDYFEPGPPDAFEAFLDAWGVDFERWAFPAIRTLYVYSMAASASDTLPPTMEALFAYRDLIEPERQDHEADIDHHTMQAFGDLGVELALAGRAAMARKVLDGMRNESTFGQQIYGNLLRALDAGDDVERLAAAIRAVWDGYGHRNNRQPDHARRAFAKAASLDPDHVIANFELGIERAAARDYAGAKSALARAVETDGAYHDMLTSLLAALESGHNVTDKLEAVITYRHALLALSQDDLGKAEACLREATALDPELSAAQLMLGYVLTRRDAHDDAEAALTRYLASSDMPDVDAYAHMALIQAEQGRADLVRETLNRLFNNNPNARNVYGSLFDAAETGENMKRAAASVRAMWDGFEARRKERCDLARDAFARAVEQNPENALAHLELGMELAAAGSAAAALEALKNAAARNEEYRRMLANLTRALAAGEPAAAALLPAVQRYQQGILALSRGENERAEQLLREALDQDPNLHPAQAALGYTLLLIERLEEAREVLLKFIAETETPDAHAYGNLALIHMLRDEHEAARRYVRRALETDADFSERFNRFSTLLFEEQDYANAWIELERLAGEGVPFPPAVIRYIRARTTDNDAPGQSNQIM